MLLKSKSHIFVPDKVAYACESVRTNAEVLADLCHNLNYQHVLIKASDKQGRAIYHTNVFMSITTKLAVICLDALDQHDRSRIVERMEESGRKIVDISHEQVENFAGNCYEVVGEDGRRKLIISTR